MIIANEVYAIFVRGESILSRLICGVVGPFSHAAIGFGVYGDPKKAVYYEALVGKGFRGPKPLESLKEWVNEDLKRKLLIVEIPELRYVADQKLNTTDLYKRRVTYGESQLLGMWFCEKLGWDWMIQRSPDKVVCSEVLADIFLPEVDLRDSKHTIVDRVTPGSAYNRVMELPHNIIFRKGC